MKIAGYEVHPAADLFPLLEGKELEDLAADIKANGLLNPITLFAQGRKKLVLDGRNRLRACEIVGVKAAFELWPSEGSPVEWVVSQNLKRRHLSESQRAMVAAGLVPMFKAEAKERQQGGQGGVLLSANLREANGKSTEKAAAAANVSPRSVETALKVILEATPEVVEAVRTGKLAVSAAARLANEEEDTQRAVVERLADGEAKNAFQAIRQIEEQRRSECPAPEVADASVLIGDVRETLNAYTIQGAPHCVVMDPPYGLDTHNTRRGGKDYEDGDRYALELLDFVCERLVEMIDPSAHIYVFSGYTHAHAFRLVLEKHFTVQDNPLIWVKDNHTMCDFSSWYPNKHEYIWFCKSKGSTRKLAKCVPDVLEFPRERDSTHSAEKPTALLRTLIENSTDPGELVIDPFAGSGSTGVACVESKRRFIGIELDEKWAAVARSRIAAA